MGLTTIDFDTPVELPYFAPADQLPVPLPSFEEIKDSIKEMLVFGDNDRSIVRFGEHFVIKYGTGVKLIEGENMLFVRQNCTIPVPKLYAMYQIEDQNDDEEIVKINVIVTEYIHGKTIWDCLNQNGFTRGQEESVIAQLKAQFNELRSISPPSPSFYGVLARRPYEDPNWNIADRTGRGPFESANKFLDILFPKEHPTPCGRSSRINIQSCRTEFHHVSRAHINPVFTHADFHAQNVILREDGVPCLIDWERAAWYPAYWEYITSAPESSDLTTWHQRRWLTIVNGSLDKYEEEWAVLDKFWSDTVDQIVYS
ncbi:hypothetical protein F5B20DRAFT_583829 [Whalleya microplaca]|nr:hypothetical protein F5B20DRAFT_583829 [Whalleya microplaca]